MSSQTKIESKGVALVTGAAQGIGHAIALQLAADGFDVAVNDIVSKKSLLEGVKEEIVKAGRTAAVFCADISVDAEVKAMVAGTVETLGGLDVMVANAGICRPRLSLIDVDVAEWDSTFATNARGTFLCYKYAAKQMIVQGRGGRIIGACSGAGKKRWLHELNIPSRFAIRGLTQAAALEFGKHGITINAYAPGHSLLADALIEVFAPLAGMSVEALVAAVNLRLYIQHAQQSAIGKNQTPEEIATLVSFLASKEASFITGEPGILLCLIVADGGRYFD
ncbi:hypothetical protein C8R43DRAFT_1197699 [Mycena crocata]|nr:hypothetical protein C8R43DRAFT_1197699 [Mycena crocata]